MRKMLCCASRLRAGVRACAAFTYDAPRGSQVLPAQPMPLFQRAMPLLYSRARRVTSTTRPRRPPLPRAEMQQSMRAVRRASLLCSSCATPARPAIFAVAMTAVRAQRCRLPCSFAMPFFFFLFSRAARVRMLSRGLFIAFHAEAMRDA